MTQSRSSTQSIHNQLQIWNQYQTALLQDDFDSALFLWKRDECLRQGLRQSNQDTQFFLSQVDPLFQLALHSHKYEMIENLWDDHPLLQCWYREGMLVIDGGQPYCISDNKVLNLIENVFLTYHPGLINKILGGNQRVLVCWTEMTYTQLVSVLNIIIKLNATDDYTLKTINDCISAIVNPFALSKVLKPITLGNSSIISMIENRLTALTTTNLASSDLSSIVNENNKREFDEISDPVLEDDQNNKKRKIEDVRVSNNYSAVFQDSTRFDVTTSAESVKDALSNDLVEIIKQHFPTKSELTTQSANYRSGTSLLMVEKIFCVEIQLREKLKSYQNELKLIGIELAPPNQCKAYTAKGKLRINIIDFSKYEAAINKYKQLGTTPSPQQIM